MEIDFEKMNGLVPAVVQDDGTGEVLMLGFMNREALQRTLETGLVTYFSRTRQALWTKGSTSGHVQKVRAIYLDCDRDSLLFRVEQVGGTACHLGTRSCFSQKIL